VFFFWRQNIYLFLSFTYVIDFFKICHQIEEPSFKDGLQI